MERYKDFKFWTPGTTVQDVRKMGEKPPTDLWPEVLEKDVQIPMPDGFENRGRVYSPSSGAESGPFLVMVHGGKVDAI